MFFRKRIQKSCSYCRFGTRIDDEQILCTKRGAVSQDHKCLKFKYDPCKRIPPKPKALDFSKYDQVDFSL